MKELISEFELSKGVINIKEFSKCIQHYNLKYFNKKLEDIPEVKSESEEEITIKTRINKRFRKEIRPDNVPRLKLDSNISSDKEKNTEAEEEKIKKERPKRRKRRKYTSDSSSSDMGKEEKN